MKKEIVQYGKFIGGEWKPLKGLESVKNTLDRIKEEIDWSGYELWCHGGILLDVETYDIDCTILGPVMPRRIGDLLEACVRIGFEEKTYVDIKYSMSNELYNPEMDTTKTILYACYDGKITINGTTFDYAKQVRGLWLKESTYPLTKTKNNSLIYKAPVKLI